MYRFAETKNRRNASIWFNSKPGVSERGKQRPQISGILELTPDMVKKIIEHGEIGEDQMLQLRISAWKNDFRKADNHPSHRGSLDFSQEQYEEFKKKAS